MSGLIIFFGIGCNSAHNPGSSDAVDWDEPITVASGAAYVGPWKMNRSNWNYVDDPTVDQLPRGTVAVGWVDQGKKNIYFQRYDREGLPEFESPTSVSRSSHVFSWFPDLVVDSSLEPEHVYVLWQEIVFSGGTHGGEIFFARSLDGGKSFEDPINLSHSPQGDGKGRLTKGQWSNGSLDLERGPEGRLYAAWTEYEGRLWVSSSVDSGASFSKPRLIAGRSGEPPARGPNLSVGPDWVHLVWTTGASDQADIHYRTLKKDARLGLSSKVVQSTNGHSDAPEVEVDDRGNPHVVWAESPSGRGERYELRYTRCDSGGTNFKEPQVLGADSYESVRSFHYPSLELDDDGNPYILWELIPKENPERAYGLGLIFSTDRGESFETPGIVPGTLTPKKGFNGSLQGNLFEKLDVENDGDLAIVNSTFDPADTSRVMLYRGKVSRNLER